VRPEAFSKRYAQSHLRGIGIPAKRGVSKDARSMAKAMADDLLGRRACDHPIRTLHPLTGCQSRARGNIDPEPVWLYQ
jgi:hypothetical protein